MLLTCHHLELEKLAETVPKDEKGFFLYKFFLKSFEVIRNQNVSQKRKVTYTKFYPVTIQSMYQSSH